MMSGLHLICGYLRDFQVLSISNIWRASDLFISIKRGLTSWKVILEVMWCRRSDAKYGRQACWNLHQLTRNWQLFCSFNFTTNIYKHSLYNSADSENSATNSNGVSTVANGLLSGHKIQKWTKCQNWAKMGKVRWSAFKVPNTDGAETLLCNEVKSRNDT